MQETQFLTTNDAAKLAGRSVETIRLWNRTGRLPAIRTTSGQRLFQYDDVVAAREAAERHIRERAESRGAA
jgi:excisionase family DNA binding protein